MTRQRATELLRAAATKRILVVGDLILDEFIWGSVDRISPEAPVPVVHLTGESWYPGGAANVARNLREFTSTVSIAGVVGDDHHGVKLRSLLADHGVNVAGVITDPSRPTIVKTRIVARHQQVVRVDREKTGVASAEATQDIGAYLESAIATADGIIVADYAKGVLQSSIVDLLARHKSILTVDPKPANPQRWRNATAIKPNRSEAMRVAGPGTPEEVGARLLEQWDTRMVLMTLGEDGMMLFEREAAPFHIETRAREVFDVSGAGDTAISMFTLSLCAGATPREAAELANAASGVVVGKLGTAVLSPEELLGAIA